MDHRLVPYLIINFVGVSPMYVPKRNQYSNHTHGPWYENQLWTASNSWIPCPKQNATWKSLNVIVDLRVIFFLRGIKMPRKCIFPIRMNFSRQMYISLNKYTSACCLPVKNECWKGCKSDCHFICGATIHVSKLLLVRWLRFVLNNDDIFSLH